MTTSIILAYAAFAFINLLYAFKKNNEYKLTNLTIFFVMAIAGLLIMYFDFLKTIGR